MGIRQKFIHDAGVTNPIKQREINDQGGDFESTPVSSFAIHETTNLVFTNRFIEGKIKQPSFYDGGIRPGTAA
jgi:hypothetical protein